MKLLIIIPAYNEAENIAKVVTALNDAAKQHHYLVVNDGSKDCTAQICRENGYRMVDLPVNLGLTGAFQTGMRYAWENGYDAALQFDGDGQHDPAYISVMLDEMQRTGCDVVIGSRFVNQKRSRSLRMLGNALLETAIRLTTGKHISDPTSGMRMYSRSVMRGFVYDMNYSPEPDTISYLLRSGADVREVQVEMHERQAGQSYLTLGRSIRYMLHMGINILFIQFFRARRK